MNRIKKVAICASSFAIIGATVGGIAYFDSSAKESVVCESNDNGNLELSSSTDAINDESELLTNKISKGLKSESKDAYKNETVYAFADSKGCVNDIIVNEHLNNKDGENELVDLTDLYDIENLKGDETYTIEGNKIIWNASGKDIYYQGKSDKKLPVDMKITYSLDGKVVDASQLAGKTGKVKIRFDYINNSTVKKKINDKEENIKIPFVAITGVVLNDNFKNVEVTNGKIISEGDADIVLGYAIPGLVDSIGVEKSDFNQDFNIPDYFEFTADVEDFELGMTITMIANGSNMIMRPEMKLDSLDEMMNGMSNAGKQLSAGSNDLTNGISTLNSKMGEFNTGMGELKNGIDSLADGSATIASGIYSVNDSANAIANGISYLDSALNAPMSDAEISEVAGRAQAQIEASFAPGTDTYNYIYGTASAQFADTMTSQATIDMIYQGLYGNLHDSLYSAGVANAWQYAVSNGMEVTLEDIAASQGGGIEAQIQSSLYELASGIANGIATNGKDSMGANVVDACKQSASASASQAAILGAEGAKASIAGQIESVQSNGYSLVTGSQALAEGTSKLASGVPILTNGINDLSKGANTLSYGSSQLLFGTNQLLDGSTELRDGINKFNNEAIDKMVLAYNGDVKGFVSRMEAVIEASSEYQTYTMLDSDKKGTTKIIIKTEEIK